MHKIGVALTIVFLIVGLWDVAGIYENECFESLHAPARHYRRLRRPEIALNRHI